MAWWLAIVAQAAGLSATNYATSAPMHAPTAAPSWADEFSGAAVDDGKWRFDVGMNRQGWPNHELEYYAPGSANAGVADGALTIEARHDAPARAADYGGQAYSAAKLISRAGLGYGFYEVRAKLPCGRGMWPAIWLLPDSGQWPAMGEIDVMEMVGFDSNVIHATLHSEKFNHRLGTQRGAELTVPTACTAFHRYQLSWQPHEILIGVDDHGYMRVADDQPGGAAAWPFTRPFHLILNLAVGGDWGGKQGIDDAALPQRMAVDYVRYWRGPS